MKVGVIVNLNKNTNVNKEFENLKNNNFDNCQLVCWDESSFTADKAKEVITASKLFNIEITALWCGWQRPAVWDFYEGPVTLGVVPPTYRFVRCETLIKGANFAKLLGVKDLVTHAGFIPENPTDHEYPGLISALKYVCRTLKSNNQRFLFETGQETPVTLLRTIEDIGMDNVGVNLDPANLLLYGKGNPVDSLRVLGKYIWGVHAKDGEYPTCGKYLGDETPIGKGSVDFPKLIKGLKDLGYDSALTIENEMGSGDELKEILESKAYLEDIIISNK